MRVSVALCTYNGRPFLSEQLDSILSQSLPPDEIVVFDDNSSDGTREILDDYADEYPDTFDINCNDETNGVVKNFERCIQACSGDIIALSDQDDVWRENKLERQVQVFRRHDPLLAFHNSTVTDQYLSPKSDLWSEVSYSAGRVRHPETALIELVRRNVVQGATACLSSQLISEITPIPSMWSHDYYIALIATLRGGIYDIDEELLRYRQHEKQVLGARSSLREKLLRGARTGIIEYQQEAQKWEIAKQKLQSFENPEITVDRGRAESLFQQRIDFESRRASIRNPNIKTRTRIDEIRSSMDEGLYGEYANGFQSILKDIITAVCYI